MENKNCIKVYTSCPKHKCVNTGLIAVSPPLESGVCVCGSDTSETYAFTPARAASPDRFFSYEQAVVDRYRRFFHGRQKMYPNVALPTQLPPNKGGASGR